MMIPGLISKRPVSVLFAEGNLSAVCETALPHKTTLMDGFMPRMALKVYYRNKLRDLVRKRLLS